MLSDDISADSIQGGNFSQGGILCGELCFLEDTGARKKGVGKVRGGIRGGRGGSDGRDGTDWTFGGGGAKGNRRGRGRGGRGSEMENVGRVGLFCKGKEVMSGGEDGEIS